MSIKVREDKTQLGIISEGFVQNYTADTLSFLLHYLAEMRVCQTVLTVVLPNLYRHTLERTFGTGRAFLHCSYIL